MGSVMDQERPWEREVRPKALTIRDRIKDVLRDTNSLHDTVEQIICELERLEEKMSGKLEMGSKHSIIDYYKSILSLMEQGATMTLSDIPGDSSMASYHFPGTAVKEIREIMGNRQKILNYYGKSEIDGSMVMLLNLIMSMT